MTDWLIWGVVGLVGLLALWFLGRLVFRKARRAWLMSQFDNEEFVDTIMEGRIAQGMSAEMVIASWGAPAGMDEKVMKTKTKRKMKYDQKGKNRFGTRVYLENGVVVGWETK